jgi:hypothetical protein
MPRGENFEEGELKERADEVPLSSPPTHLTPPRDMWRAWSPWEKSTTTALVAWPEIRSGIPLNDLLERDRVILATNNLE